MQIEEIPQSPFVAHTDPEDEVAANQAAIPLTDLNPFSQHHDKTEQNLWWNQLNETPATMFPGIFDSKHIQACPLSHPLVSAKILSEELTAIQCDQCKSSFCWNCSQYEVFHNKLKCCSEQSIIPYEGENLEEWKEFFQAAKRVKRISTNKGRFQQFVANIVREEDENVELRYNLYFQEQVKNIADMEDIQERLIDAVKTNYLARNFASTSQPDASTELFEFQLRDLEKNLNEILDLLLKLSANIQKYKNWSNQDKLTILEDIKEIWGQIKVKINLVHAYVRNIEYYLNFITISPVEGKFVFLLNDHAQFVCQMNELYC